MTDTASIEIQRYACRDSGEYMDQYDDGDFVYYADHAETVQQFQEQIRLLENDKVRLIAWREQSDNARLNEYTQNQRLRDQVQQLQRENAELKCSKIIVHETCCCGECKPSERTLGVVTKAEYKNLFDLQQFEKNLLANVRAELAAAKQRLAESEKDAARYQWLKSRENQDWRFGGGQEVRFKFKSGSADVYDLDGCIDAARTAQAGENQNG